MPKVKNDTESLVKEYLDKHADKITEQTRRTYLSVGSRIPFNILTTQQTIIKKLKEVDDNPNTTALNLNVIILVRRSNEEDTSKLVAYRNSLRERIVKLRKAKLAEIKHELPSMETLESLLKEMQGLPYVINYLFLRYGLRNKDINLLIVDKLPEEMDKNENYLVQQDGKKKSASLYINDYKTDSSYGAKVIKIRDSRFNRELRKMGLKDGDYLFSKKNGGKMSLSTFNEKIKSMSLNNLGEAKIFKVLIAHLIDKKDYKKIEALVDTRGTSMTTIMKSYNIYNSE